RELPGRADAELVSVPVSQGDDSAAQGAHRVAGPFEGPDPAVVRHGPRQPAVRPGRLEQAVDKTGTAGTGGEGHRSQVGHVCLRVHPGPPLLSADVFAHPNPTNKPRAATRTGRLGTPVALYSVERPPRGGASRPVPARRPRPAGTQRRHVMNMIQTPPTPPGPRPGRGHGPSAGRLQ